MNEPGLLRSTDLETSNIGKLVHYEYGSDETNDIQATDADNLHDMFDVSLTMVPDIEGTLLCTEALSASSGSDNDDQGVKQVSKRQRCIREHHHHHDNNSSEREDSGFTSSEASSSPPQEVPNRSISPSGSEADAEESDTEMEQHIGNGIVQFRSWEINPALFVSNSTTTNTTVQRSLIRNRETTGNTARLRNNNDSVVPSSPIFGTSNNSSGDAYVPYIDSDELISDASSSDGDNGRHMYSCMNNDHVVPQIYIEE